MDRVAQRDQESRSVGAMHHFNDRAIESARTVASTPVGDSTVGSIAVDIGMRHIVKKTTHRVKFLSRIE